MAITTARRSRTGVVDRTVADDENRTSGPRRRRHGAGVPFDREELERSGWRTTMEYRENHVRRRDGRLDHLEVVWSAEAERSGPDGSLVVVTASAHSPAKVWSALRREADLVARRPGPAPTAGALRDAGRTVPPAEPARRGRRSSGLRFGGASV